MKTSRFAVAALVLVLTSPTIFAVNDFWLGYCYNVAVSFMVKHETYIDPPNLKALPMPSYPIELLSVGVQGYARIQFLVREDGTVTDVTIAGTDFEAFGKEAKKTVEMWSFTPGKNRNSGKPASVQMQCRFDFKMDEAGVNKTTSSNGDTVSHAPKK